MSRLNLSMAREYVKLLKSFRLFQVGQPHRLTGISASLNHANFSTNREVSESLDKTEAESENNSQTETLNSQSYKAQAPVIDDSPAPGQFSATEELLQKAVKVSAPTDPIQTPVAPTATKKKDSITDRLLRMSGTMGPSEYDNQIHSSMKGRPTSSSANDDDDEEEYGQSSNGPRGFRGNHNNNNYGRGGGGRNWK